MHYKVTFHTQKSRSLLKLLPDPNSRLRVMHYIIRAEAVSKIWAKPKQKFGQVLVNCLQIILLT